MGDSGIVRLSAELAAEHPHRSGRQSITSSGSAAAFNRPDQYRFDGTSPTELRGNGSVTVNVTPFKKAEEHPINQ